MQKVILLAESVSPVRAPIYNLIAQECDFTIGYVGKIPDNLQCKSIKLERIRFCRMDFYKNHIGKLLSQYDAAIIPMDVHKIDLCWKLLFSHPCKMIAWGIGVPASYTVRFDDPQIHNFMPFYVKYSDAVLFYSDYPQKKYVAKGYPREKMFVANNTVVAEPISPDRKRDSLLFVGSLYPAKRTDILIDAYIRLAQKGIQLMPLHIIGDGSEREKLEQQVKQAKLENLIQFHGSLYSDEALLPYYEKAYAVLSPGQAGLTVLKAMGYAVPFVSTKDAYTGGERLNIHDGIDGVLMDKEEDIEQVIQDIHCNPGKYEDMGKRAFDYYQRERRPEQMARGFLDAISYVGGKSRGMK